MLTAQDFNNNPMNALMIRRIMLLTKQNRIGWHQLQDSDLV
jgi:hypothetical protein